MVMVIRSNLVHEVRCFLRVRRQLEGVAHDPVERPLREKID